MPHITIDGWCYRDGRVSPAMAKANEHHFAFLRDMMSHGKSEAQAQKLYDEAYPQPRPGQADCPDCGLWTCEAPHE